MLTHASIVPLIGGETIAQQNVLGILPQAIYSFDNFKDNDQHLVNYYKGLIPYYRLDKDYLNVKNVDIVNTVCPCAGLSSMSSNACSDNPLNNWMIKTAKFVLTEIKPQVFWGENAPRLAGKSGESVVRQLAKLGKENGYTISIYRTKSLKHGLPQVRERTFYFMWKSDKVPAFEYFNRQHIPIEDLIKITSNGNYTQQFSVVKAKPTDDPYYKYVLEEMLGGAKHKDFYYYIKKTSSPMDFIEQNNVSYLDVAKWMKSHGYDKRATRCETIYYKLKEGKNIMRRITAIPRDYTGAFVGHLSTLLTHPVKNRYITVREALSIMGMPTNFELINPKKNINHICQNVPVTTAEDMVKEIIASLNNKRVWVDAKVVYQFNNKVTPEMKIYEFKDECNITGLF